MSDIQKGMEESLRAKVTKLIPEELKDHNTKESLKKVAKIVEKNLDLQIVDLKSALDDAAVTRQLYSILAADGFSFQDARAPITTTLTTQIAKLEERVAFLTSDDIKNLPAIFTECTKNASVLKNSFNEISDILVDLHKDINQKDTNYDALLKEIKKMDKEAAKKDEVSERGKLEGQLNALKNSQEIDSLIGKIKADHFTALYECLRDLSLNYQEKLVAQVSNLSSAVEQLSGNNEKLTSNLTDNLTAFEKEEADALTALNDANTKLSAIKALKQGMKDLDQFKVDLFEKPETDQPEEEPPAPLADEVLESKKKALKKILDEQLEPRLADVTASITRVEEIVEIAKKIRTTKQSISEKLNARIALLESTSGAAAPFFTALLKDIDPVVSSINDNLNGDTGLVNAQLVTIEKPGPKGGTTEEKQDMQSLIFDRLSDLADFEVQLSDLISGMDKATVGGDIKNYFGKIGLFLESFKEPAKLVMGQILEIKSGIQQLSDWSKNLHEEVSAQLIAPYQKSTYHISPNHGQKTKADKLVMARLNSSKNLLSGIKKSLEEASGKTKLEENLPADDSEKLLKLDPTSLHEWQDIIKIAPNRLAEWKTALEREQARITDEIADKEAQIEFINGLVPEPEAA